MVTNLLENYPATRMVVVGFSMGANIVVKYLGERRPDMPKNIMGGISICQGYDALRYKELQCQSIELSHNKSNT